MKSTSTFHERLAARGALIGLLQAHPNVIAAEMAGSCGYDFLLLDGEHGLFGDTDYSHGLRSLAAAGTLAAVRLPKQDLQAVGRFMDMGADVIVVPNVATAAEAQALVRAMEYPPKGTRGFGAPLHRATRYGMDVVTHLRAPRADVALLAIIESASGVANVEEILAVEGIDGVIVGPYDLSADLGHAGDFSTAAYTRAMLRIERAAAGQSKILGTAPHPGNPLEALVARGHRFILLGSDTSLLREAMSAQVAQARLCLHGTRHPKTL